MGYTSSVGDASAARCRITNKVDYGEDIQTCMVYKSLREVSQLTINGGTSKYCQEQTMANSTTMLPLRFLNVFLTIPTGQ